MANQFTETKERFKAATCAVKYPIKYEDWMEIDDSLKCAALYVNFYSQIQLAWKKLEVYYVETEEAVSIVIQYLIGNVDLIKADPKRFAPNYIYKVAYNAILGITRTQNRKNYYDTYMSASAEIDDESGEHDMFSILENPVDCFRDNKFKQFIDSMDDTTKAYVSHLIWGTKLTKKDLKKESLVMGKLREFLASEIADFDVDGDTEENKPSDEKPVVKFKDIWKDDDKIESAVCVMSDGEQAVYYGEKQILHGSYAINILFFGSKKDYVVPLKVAKDLVVTDVEYYL